MLIIDTWSIEKNFLVEKYAENVHLKLVRPNFDEKPKIEPIPFMKTFEILKKKKV